MVRATAVVIHHLSDWLHRVSHGLYGDPEWRLRPGDTIEHGDPLTKRLDQARIADALDNMVLARKDALDAIDKPDPVERRRLMVAAAARFRRAADLLDDHGRIDGG